jgi:ABC-2 type transport system permease protein
MNFSIKRVTALLIKELQDFYKNPNVLFMLIMPICVTLLYRKISGSHSSNPYILSLCLYMNFTIVGCFVIAMLIAEEKEKNTLRTLMLSPMTAVEFVVGKFLMSGFLLMAINLFIFFTLKVDPIYILPFILITLITTIIILFIGAIIGLLSKDQMQTSIIGFLPMCLLMVPLFAKYTKILTDISNLLPTYHCGEVLTKVMSGGSLFSMKINILVLLIWVVFSFLIFGVVYSKNRLD